MKRNEKLSLFLFAIGAAIVITAAAILAIRSNTIRHGLIGLIEKKEIVNYAHATESKALEYAREFTTPMEVSVTREEFNRVVYKYLNNLRVDYDTIDKDGKCYIVTEFIDLGRLPSYEARFPQCLEGEILIIIEYEYGTEGTLGMFDTRFAVRERRIKERTWRYDERIKEINRIIKQLDEENTYEVVSRTEIDDRLDEVARDFEYRTSTSFVDEVRKGQVNVNR